MADAFVGGYRDYNADLAKLKRVLGCQRREGEEQRRLRGA
jgi:hypothetical protein